MAGASWHAALPSWIEIATAKKVEVFVSEGLCTDEVLKNQMGKNHAAGRSGEFAFFNVHSQRRNRAVAMGLKA